MKIIYKSLVLVALVFLSCEKEGVPKGTPECLERIIKGIKDDYDWNPPAKIFSYVYEGEKVYYIPPRCCDIPGTLLDVGCNKICSPDGGLGGTGDGKCPEFFTSRSHGEINLAGFEKVKVLIG